MNPVSPAASTLKWAGFILGVSLGGFFDGILLHQVLQWHHLLSNVRAAALQDLRAQVLADGLFHVLMYAVAAWGLVLLWRARTQFGRPGADRVLGSLALAGFGVWHVLDTVLSHWVTGIHRVRVDSPNPLFWDLLWLVLFGLLPLALGWWTGRRPGAGGERGRATALMLALAAVLAGPLAAWPSQGDGPVLVMFRPGMEGAPAFDALGRADARVVWADRSGGMWAVELAGEAGTAALYAGGAILVSRSPVALGCFSWLRPAA